MNCFFTEPLYFLICDNVEVHKIVLKRPSIIFSTNYGKERILSQNMTNCPVISIIRDFQFMCGLIDMRLRVSTLSIKQ